MKLLNIANNIRKDIVTMVYNANSGHPGGPLGLADIFTILYFKVLNHKPKKPDWDNRDRLVMSNGHACAVRYAAMARAGYFPVSELKTYRKLGSRLQGHPSMRDLPGLETSSGSLGQGLGIAVGMALAAKMDGKKHKIYCVISDGDLDEGSSWEASMAASKWKLDNLIVIVDRNGIQISGYTEEVWPLHNLKKKFEAFGWHTYQTDGHNLKKLERIFTRANHGRHKPIVIIAKTVLGKGVSFMENRPEWHGKPPSKEEYEHALRDLK